MGLGRSARSRRPRLYTSAEGERHAGWLELFFDLVFVLAIAELAHYLHGHTTATGFLGFAFLFVPVWWSWLGFSYYADQFDVEGPVFRGAMLVAMLLSLALAVNVYEAFGDASFGFAASYLALRVLLILLYAWAWRHVPEARALCARYVAGFTAGAALWLASLFVAEPARYWVWALALLVEVATPVVAYLSVLPNVPIQVSHMPERFGLFTIIVLGESIVLTGMGVSETEWDAGSVLVAVAGFAVVACLWWIYFDRIDEAIMYRSYSSGVRELLQGYAWSYAHLGIFAGLTATAVGIELAIQDAPGGTSGIGTLAALCGGVVLYLISLAAVHRFSTDGLSGRVLAARLGAATVAVLLVFAGPFLAPPPLAAVLAATLVALTVFEARNPASPDPPAPGRATHRRTAGSAVRPTRKDP